MAAKINGSVFLPALGESILKAGKTRDFSPPINGENPLTVGLPASDGPQAIGNHSEAMSHGPSVLTEPDSLTGSGIYGRSRYKYNKCTFSPFLGKSLAHSPPLEDPSSGTMNINRRFVKR